MSWKRPESVTFPQVWSTFEAKDPDSGRIVKYRIQDLPEERFEEVVQLMGTTYIQDESTCKSLDLFNDPTFNANEIWDKVVKKNISIVCFKEGSKEICGLNILVVAEKDANDLESSCKNVQEIIKVMNYVKSKADPFNRFGQIDKFLYSLGLLVVPKYRGLGISTEILKARVPLGRTLGFKVTGTVFSGIASQKAAAKAGYVEDFSVLYEDLKNHGDFIEFPNISSPSINFMSLQLD